LLERLGPWFLRNEPCAGRQSRMRNGAVRSLGHPGVKVGVEQRLAQLPNGKLSM
jgi:hypothetical protein